MKPAERPRALWWPNIDNNQHYLPGNTTARKFAHERLGKRYVTHEELLKHWHEYDHRLHNGQPIKPMHERVELIC